MNPNRVVQFLKKLPNEFTREDIIRFCVENEVECVNLHYSGWDHKLKTLNFVINSQEHLEEILDAGERVDGSSLFPFIEAGRSDLYVMPRLKTAFVNPFADVMTLDFLCDYYDRDGQPFASSPRYILYKASEAFKQKTGMALHTMGELEYYVVSPIEEGTEDTLYQIPPQTGYHQSAPYCKFGDLRTDAMQLIAQCGGQIKYGHSEVGNFVQDGKLYEQNEIEFLPIDIEDAADNLVIAEWVMFQLAYEYGVELTFLPKITAGMAGSGLHVHMKLVESGETRDESSNCMTHDDGSLTDDCKRAIAGLMIAGTSLPAWGNPSKESFQRLVPHQEAPTSLCWSFSNRSALVRVPLGWQHDRKFAHKQTFEWRASDGTAEIHLLMAALCCAARHGFEAEDALKVAETTYVDLGVNIHDEKNKELHDRLQQLPASTAEAADELEKNREIYTSMGVFSDSLVDYQTKWLRK